MTTEAEETPSLAEVIIEAVDGVLLDTHTSLPCKVQSYNVGEGSVHCSPVIGRIRLTESGGKVVDSLPLLQDVPVCFPRGGGTSITWPLSPGDFVTVVFAEGNIGTWLATGNEGDPGDLRRHTLSGAMALPCGPYPYAQADPDANEDALTLTAGEIRLGSSSATEYAARADRVEAELSAIKAAIAGAATGSVIIFKTAILAALAGFPASVATDKVKAE